jgi:hypothetical protein
MRGLFDNISILIPIALLIALRIINAKSKQNKKNQQKKPAGENLKKELIRRIQEAQRNPDYRGGKAEAREVMIPSVVPQKVPPKKTVPAKKEIKKSNAAFPVENPIEAKPLRQSTVPIYSAEPERRGFPPDNADQDKAAVQKVVAASQSGEPALLRNLPPLQQAVVWAEILGQPKSISPGGIS